MFRTIRIFLLFSSIILIALSSCNSNTKHSTEKKPIDTLLTSKAKNLDTFALGFKEKRKKPNSDSIVGDTVWVNQYAIRSWSDTITTSVYTAHFLVWIDTTDFIIDTVKSSKGDRIVIGFNHYYRIDFDKGNKHWFTVLLNKKKDFRAILDDTDSWLESNLNVFKNLLYNKKYDQFVVEFNLNSHSNFGSLYYIIFDTKGESKYIGTANSWGGEGPDGEPFLTENDELFVTCYEIYNFRNSTSMTFSQYVSIAESRSNKNSVSEFIQIHGLRDLSKNNFLAVFNRFHGEPTYNAFILNTDTSVVCRFSYYGIVEEMDAILLYTEDQKRSFLYDTEREKLICITKLNKPGITELSVNEMRSYSDDTCSPENYSLLDFNMYGSYEFYTSSDDTLIYVKKDRIK